MVNVADSLLASLTWFNWINLAAALLLFLGPGYCFLTCFSDRHSWSFTQGVALSLGLSISLWSLLLEWLYALQIALSPLSVVVILSATWAIGLLRTHPQFRIRRVAWRGWIRAKASDLLLWVVLLVTVLVGLVALRHVLVGPGSDSYHHTLIAQIIADRGMLPANFEPYAPLVTFTYHFGFHGVAAAVVWLTGLSAIPIAPILAQVLMAAAALSVAFFVEVAFHNRLATLISAAIVGLASVFPAYYINWGRYTQLTGLVLLPLFLGLIWYSAEADFQRATIPTIGALAAGIALAHYRVTLMAALGTLAFLGFALIRRANWTMCKHAIMQQCAAAAIAGTLIAPWVWHIYSARQQGYPIDVGNTGSSFFALDRLDGALNFSTNNVLVSLAVIAIALGLWRRERVVMALATWAVLMLLLSGPLLASVFMDTISVVLSLFFPVAAIIAWLVTIVERPGRCWTVVRLGVYGMLTILCASGIFGIAYVVEPGLSYVQADDLRAMEWIQSHTSTSARFMVNTYHWDFQPNLITGSDAGYWMPLLANRGYVLVPVMYSFERSNVPDLNDHLVALDRLDGHLTSLEAVRTLRSEGVTHIFVGQRGGPIIVQELLQSPAFKLEYQSGAAYVFSLQTTE